MILELCTKNPFGCKICYYNQIRLVMQNTKQNLVVYCSMNTGMRFIKIIIYFAIFVSQGNNH